MLMYTKPHTQTQHINMYIDTQLPHTYTHTHTQTCTHTTMYTQDGYCPLIVASQEGHDGIVEKLLQAGATVDLKNKVDNNCYYLLICH